MTALDERDYFTDMAVLRDPYEYFEAIRAHGPIFKMKNRDLWFVPGYQECLDILLNGDDFSSVIAVDPISPLPYEVEPGEDISAKIEANRGGNVMRELMVAYDGEQHRAARSLLNG